MSEQVAGPWAKVIEVGRRVEEGDVSGARRAIDELEGQWPDHLLATGNLYPRTDGSAQNLRRRLETSASALEVSMRLIRPCAIGEPRILPCTM